MRPPPPTAEMPSEVPPKPPAPDPLARLRDPPPGFVDLRTAVPGACFSVGYHTRDNFTGAPLPGYGAPGAWMLEAPATALGRVQADLADDGLTLLIYDAYRPARGTKAMVAWAERTDQVLLLDTGYIARRSGHNHGHTIDLTLATRSCQPIDMGTAWDTLDERSHTRNATGTALENRLELKDAMQAHGFVAYPKEWWHFTYPVEGSRPRDVPYGCQEPDEGQWQPPTGWARPGYEPALEVDDGPCG